MNIHQPENVLVAATWTPGVDEATYEASHQDAMAIDPAEDIYDVGVVEIQFQGPDGYKLDPAKYTIEIEPQLDGEYMVRIFFIATDRKSHIPSRKERPLWARRGR